MPGEVFYYADEFNISWLPTLRAMWSPKGQQVMIPPRAAMGSAQSTGIPDKQW